MTIITTALIQSCGTSDNLKSTTCSTEIDLTGTYEEAIEGIWNPCSISKYTCIFERGILKEDRVIVTRKIGTYEIKDNEITILIKTQTSRLPPGINVFKISIKDQKTLWLNESPMVKTGCY